MLAEPKLVDRGEQLYAAIQAHVTMNEIDATLPPLIPEVYAWLQRQGVPPVGPPFFRFLVIDMARELEIEVGVPVATPVREDDRVRAGAFPAGRYATALHTGPYDQLIAATATLLAWAEVNGIVWQVQETEKGDAWAARAEFYLNDPKEEPDPEKWRTELAFLVADDQIAEIA
jgi:effector-binding domain-containing protein